MFKANEKHISIESVKRIWLKYFSPNLIYIYLMCSKKNKTTETQQFCLIDFKVSSATARLRGIEGVMD